MATRRARFKPVLTQPARRGRSSANDAQPAEATKEAAVSQDQSDKNLCLTPNQKAVNDVIKTELSSSQAIKNNPSGESSTIQTKPTPYTPKDVNQPSTVDESPVGVKAAEEVFSVKESPQQATTPIASSSKQDAASTPQAAAPAPPAANQLPTRLPLRRPSSPAQSLSETSPVKGEAGTRSSKDDRKETAPSARPRRQPSSMNQRALAARRNFMKLAKDGPPQRSSLTMFDLIFYNPVTNPMSKKSPPPAKVRERQASTSSVSTVQEQKLEEEKVDDVDENQIKESEDKENKEEEEEEPAVPVPRVKVGPDGRIVIDEQSLVIETTESKKNREEMDKSEVVFDTGLSNGFYKRSVRSKDWSNRETLKFYRALHVYGTDFSLMQVLFKDRTRRELKLKFKKEERMRMHLIDKALCSPLDFDTTELEEEALKEEEEAARLAKEKEMKEKPKPKPKPKPVRNRKPCSLAQKEMVQDYEVSSDGPPPPKKRRIVRKAKQEPIPERQPESALKPENVPTGLDFFDDVVLPTDKITKEKSPKTPTPKPPKPTAPKKRKAPPRDPNKPPKTSKKKKANVLTSPESDHSYAASPFCSPEYQGMAATKTPPNKKARVTPARIQNQKEVSSPDVVAVNHPNHMVFTPPPTRTVTVSPTKGTTYTQLRTPKIPISLNITHSVGLPYECGPTPNTAVPVALPTYSPANSGLVPLQKPTPVEPGSFYVLQTQCPDDPKRHVLGVYMVTNKQSNVVYPPPSTNESLVPEVLKSPLSDSPSQSVTVGDPVEGTVLTKL